MDYLEAQQEPGIERVRFALYGRQAYRMYERALAQLVDVA